VTLFTADLDEAGSFDRLESQPVVPVRIDSLVVGGTPRRAGEDPAHVRLLAGIGSGLPPITVHRPTMRVVDGMHRVRAARLNGAEWITARLLDCDEDAAFIVAVRANVTHGLPLCQPDRVAAAARIIGRHPQWSDRAVAAVTGLSNKTVARLRIRPSAPGTQPLVRIGRDGRRRPLTTGPGRQQAAAMLAARPELGLRTVARATGLSVATVRDVRQRLHRGEDPVPGRYRSGRERPVAVTAQPAAPAHPPDETAGADRRALLATLCGDPSLRFTETGRHAVRWLLQHAVDAEGLGNLSAALPDRWAPAVADLARDYATSWAALAAQLDERAD
jgi:hypothetical protein